MIATSVFTPIIATAQDIDLTPPASNQQVATESFIPPYEPDHYRQVDTSDWDFNEPGMNKNNIDNHELERTLPADLGDPQPVITPGKMRSDRIPLPTGVTKEEADQAEIQEAREQGITAPGDQPMIRTFAADNCRTYWPSSFQVCGAIRAKYESMAVTWAGQTPVSFLGLPKSNELTNPDGVGKRTEFDNGFIYWHPDTGAWSVTTHNSIVWARNGWELGRLGYPTSDEIGTGDGVGRKQYFQRGRIYGSLSGVVSIEGKILEKWVETGEEKGPLGYPATDEEGTPDGVGRYNRFALGMIYWHPSYGAHYLLGEILATWSIGGFERGQYGYPLQDPRCPEDGVSRCSQLFQNGILHGALHWGVAAIEYVTPYIHFPDDESARSYFEEFRKSLTSSSSRESNGILIQPFAAKEYGPCTLTPNNLHVRTKSGSEKSIGFKPKTTCSFPVTQIEHVSDIAGLSWRNTMVTHISGIRNSNSNEASLESRNIQLFCVDHFGPRYNTYQGRTVGKIRVGEKTYYAEAFTKLASFDCAIS
ncbi:LGFP repeat-containing protein [Corynebacterium epidermidicanis]|uniref:LGFP repeat-containing protein n=1 Tax=Corynebacterium epidermidicanis TaxID=1050174 RepID=UPI001F42C156|nr:hypothetical protein [Corynebacterium epidermidicanis]